MSRLSGPAAGRRRGQHRVDDAARPGTRFFFLFFFIQDRSCQKHGFIRRCRALEPRSRALRARARRLLASYPIRRTVSACKLRGLAGCTAFSCVLGCANYILCGFIFWSFSISAGEGHELVLVTRFAWPRLPDEPPGFVGIFAHKSLSSSGHVE